MVQVLPETSNSNIWQQAARDATVGYLKGTKIRKEHEKERDKKALFAAATDPNKSPMDRTRAMEQYIGEHGEVGDIIKFQKEQGRMQGLNDIKKMLGFEDSTSQEPATTGNLGLAATNLETQQNGQENVQQIQNGQELFNGKPKAPQPLIDQALINLAQYDPPTAKTISDLLGRKQKDEIAARNEDFKEKEFAFNKQHKEQELGLKKEKLSFEKEKADKASAVENSKNLTAIQDKSMAAQVAGEKQLQSLDVIDQLNDAGDLSALSPANLSNIVGSFDNPIAQAIGRAIQSPAGAAFKTASKAQFAGLKDLWGAKPTEYETKVYSQMHADVGRSKEANDASLYLLKSPLLKEVERAKYTQRLIGEEPNINPQSLNFRVFNHMNSYGLHLKKQYDKKVEAWVSSKKKGQGEPYKPITKATGRPSLKDIYAPKK